MTAIVARRVSACAFLGLSFLVTGCGGGGNIDSEIASKASAPPADAPQTPAEYEAKHPVPNAGNAAAGKARGGSAITNP